MKRYDGSQSVPSSMAAPCVALGNFDGVHRGHQELIRNAKREAQNNNGTSVIYTFEPHPVRVLSPSLCPLQLTTLDQKLTLLEHYGIDAVVVEPYTLALSDLTPEAFFEEVILKRLHASVVIIGYDFTFGKHRAGTVEMLEGLGKQHDLQIQVVPAIFSEETLISSTAIRQMLLQRDIERANVLLGHPYEIVGEVVPGRGLGRSLRARTANLRPQSELVPPDGVYISQTRLLDEAGKETSPPMPSITSIGNNPTFQESPHVVETHLIDKDMDILGKKVAVGFISFLRDQICYTSVEELKRQIATDIDIARVHHRISSKGTPS